MCSLTWILNTWKQRSWGLITGYPGRGSGQQNSKAVLSRKKNYKMFMFDWQLLNYSVLITVKTLDDGHSFTPHPTLEILNHRENLTHISHTSEICLSLFSQVTHVGKTHHWWHENFVKAEAVSLKKLIGLEPRRGILYHDFVIKSDRLSCF